MADEERSDKLQDWGVALSIGAIWCWLGGIALVGLAWLLRSDDEKGVSMVAAYLHTEDERLVPLTAEQVRRFMAEQAK